MLFVIQQDPMAVWPLPIAESFWGKVDRRGEDECWPWTAGTDGKDGYGRAWDGERTRMAHDLAWELANSRLVPYGFLIRHDCDNPPCCNPKHLQPGTAQDNKDDAVSRGRARIPYLDFDVPIERRPCGDKNGTRTHPGSVVRGEAAVKQKSCRVGRAEVLELRKAAKGGEPQSSLCIRFNLSPAQVSRIVNRQRWAWLKDEEE